VAAQLTDENVVLFPMPGENSETIRSVPGQSIHETHSCVEPDTPLIQEIRRLTTCASFLNFSVAGIVAKPCYPLEKKLKPPSESTTDCGSRLACFV
jgi:hypothetical protein